VDREALGARDLHKDAGAVEGQRVDRLGNQEIEVVQRLRADAERRKRLDAFLAESRSGSAVRATGWLWSHGATV
jgi:hypothetical protein